MTHRPKALLAMQRWLIPELFNPTVRDQMEKLIDVVDCVESSEEILRTDRSDVEVIVGGWGCPALDGDVLDHLPRLSAVVYTAGSIKEFASAGLFRRGVSVSSGADINAIPVAEYTLAAIIMSGKNAFSLAGKYPTTNQPLPWGKDRWGNYGLTVGIVGASRIGRRVIELLAPFDFSVQFYDPIVTTGILGARRVGLDELMASSDIVSVHAPAVPETLHMIDRKALALMPDGGTLINTSRGSLVDTEALLREIRAGRLHAVLDVVDPDPLPPESELFEAPNLFLTPHIAGSVGNERQRLGEAAVRELARFVAGKPLLGAVEPETLTYSA